MRSVSDENRQLASHLERAIRELQQAEDLARRSSAARETRNLDLRKDLQRLILGLRVVESLVPKGSNRLDPDSLSEEELAKRSREKTLQKRAAKSLRLKSGPKSEE